MILACPTCRTRYQVDDKALAQAGGRTVRCANCGHSWYCAMPPPAPPLRARERPLAEPPPAAEPRAAVTAPPPTRPGRSSGHHSGLAWVVVILLIGGALVGAILGRDRIVARWPEAGRLYDAVGLKGEPLGAGLDIANVTSTRNTDGLIVEGDITNRTNVPRAVPHLRVGLRDGAQHELVFKIVDPPRDRLLPGETSHFVVGFLPAPDATSGVVVTFAAG